MHADGLAERRQLSTEHNPSIWHATRVSPECCRTDSGLNCTKQVLVNPVRSKSHVQTSQAQLAQPDLYKRRLAWTSSLHETY